MATSEALDWTPHPSYNEIDYDHIDRKTRYMSPEQKRELYQKAFEESVAEFKVTKLKRGGVDDWTEFKPVVFSQKPKRGRSKDVTEEELQKEWKAKEEKLARLPFDE
jgi:hypothetical protein